MLICEELAQFRTLIRDIPWSAAESEPLAVLTRDVVEGANLDVQSLAFQYVYPGYGEHSVLVTTEIREKYPDGVSLASPLISGSQSRINLN